KVVDTMEGVSTEIINPNICIEVEKTRSRAHTIFGAIHPSSTIYFTMKKPLSTREKCKRLRQIRMKNRTRESQQETKIKR
ncbi:hypothetical protein BD770DRAFT_321186, partial [Pilaira anomala]